MLFQLHFPWRHALTAGLHQLLGLRVEWLRGLIRFPRLVPWEANLQFDAS